MLVIKRSQLEKFSEPGLRRYMEEIGAHVRETWPREWKTLGDEAARTRVEAAVRRARSHGLDKRYDVGRFVHLAFAFEDPAFDEAGWAAEILADREVDGRIRMNRLWSAARERIAGGSGG